MKKILLSLCCLWLASAGMAQLKVKASCAALVVDILDGKVNGIKADINQVELKEKLPCFTSAEDESATAKCGGGVYYKDKDISFFTQRDYVEIGEKFQGKLSIPIMGANRNTLFKWLGNPKLKDASWDAYQMNYGTLVLHYSAAGKVKLIQFSTRQTDALSLCE